MVKYIRFQNQPKRMKNIKRSKLDKVSRDLPHGSTNHHKFLKKNSNGNIEHSVPSTKIRSWNQQDRAEILQQILWSPLPFPEKRNLNKASNFTDASQLEKGTRKLMGKLGEEFGVWIN